MATAMAQHNRSQPTSPHLTPTPPTPGPNNPNSGKAGQTSRPTTLNDQTKTNKEVILKIKIITATDPRIQV